MRFLLGGSTAVLHGWGSGGGGGGGGNWGASKQQSQYEEEEDDRGWGKAARGGGGGGGGGSGWGAPAQSRGGRGGMRGGGRGGGRGGRGGWGSDSRMSRDQFEEWRPDPSTLEPAEFELDGKKGLVGQRIFVSNLAPETFWQSFKDHFRQVGDVSYCRIFELNGTGIVEYTYPEDAAKAIMELQDTELDGSTISVREDKDDLVLRKFIILKRKAELEAVRAAKKSGAPAGVTGKATPPTGATSTKAAAPAAADDEADFGAEEEDEELQRPRRVAVRKVSPRAQADE
jgi:hypothetical protein